MSRRRLAPLCALCLAAGFAAALPMAWAHGDHAHESKPSHHHGHAHAHEHGRVQLDAALEGATLSLTLRAPLESLLGFEHAPRTDAQKQAAARLVERLRSDATLVRPDPAAGCEPGGAPQLRSGALGLGGAQEAGDGHDDLEADYVFRCRAPDRLGHIELGLVQAYAGVKRVEVQIVGAKGQARQVLRRPAQRITWPK